MEACLAQGGAWFQGTQFVAPVVSPAMQTPTPTCPPPNMGVATPAEHMVWEPSAHVDDDDNFPPLSQLSQSQRRLVSARQHKEVANARIPGAPALVQCGDGFIPICTCTQPIFALVVTQEAINQHHHSVEQAQQVQAVQACNLSSHRKPGYLVAPMGFTDVVVVCNRGVEDVEAEEVFCRCNPVDLVQAAQRALNKASWNPLLILRGRWSKTVQKTSNFVFQFVGELPIQIQMILLCKDSLCSHFPGEAWIIPTRGWTWVQLWGIDVLYVKDGVTYLYDGANLLKVFTANPCFQGVDILSPPTWQGNPLNFKQPTSTVIAAICDENNARCQRASSKGFCMFR
jgi:hypothetical protein